MCRPQPLIAFQSLLTDYRIAFFSLLPYFLTVFFPRLGESVVQFYAIFFFIDLELLHHIDRSSSSRRRTVGGSSTTSSSARGLVLGVGDLVVAVVEDVSLRKVAHLREWAP